MCPSRSSKLVTLLADTLPHSNEGWQQYALRLRQIVSDEVERVA